MAFINTVKGFFGYGEDDFEEDEYEEEEEIEEEDDEEDSPKRSFFRGQRERNDEQPQKKAPKVVPITNRNERANVQIIAPAMFDEARKAAEVVMSRRVLVLNVTKTRDVDEARRIVDFVSGTVYGLKGNIRKVNDGIFVAAPNGIDISGDNIKDHTYNNFNLL